MTVSFQPENCVGCGLCEVTCPKSAINVIKTSSGYSANITGCIECGVCTVYCNYGALTLESSPYNAILMRLGYSKVDVDEEKCTLCGKCAEVCVRDAIEVEKRLDKDRIRTGFIKVGEGCIQCRNCVIFCPTDAIRLVRGRPEINENKCIYCQICQNVCPKDVIEVHCDSCKLTPVYAVTGSIEIDKRCSLCKSCENICEFDAIKVNRIFYGVQKFDQRRCYGEDCSICLNICPNNAISYDHREGKTVVFSDACNFCGKCEKYCPGKAISIERWVSDKYEEIHLPERRRDYHEIMPAIEVNETCIGCHFCEAVCRISKEAHLSEVRGKIEPENCTTCGLCESVCPMDSIKVFELT